MYDDCYLPWQKRTVSSITSEASLSATSGDPDPLRTGQDRPIGEDENQWVGWCGDRIEYRFDAPQQLGETRIVFDSDLNRGIKNMPHIHRLGQKLRAVPDTLVKAFRLEVEVNGKWENAVTVLENHQRLVKLDLNTADATAVRLTPDETWGSDQVRIFSWEIS
jgi:hypothetical protein